MLIIESIRDLHSIYEQYCEGWKFYPQKIFNVAGLYTKIQNKSDVPSQIKSFGSTSHKLNEDELMIGWKLGIDTHADSSCTGRHIRPLECISGKRYSVTPFHDSYAPKTDVSMINGVVAVDKPDGGGFILKLNNFLDFTSSMNDLILVLMQARQNNIVIDDIPKGLCYHEVSTQTIFIPKTNIKIPIEFHGPTPYVKIQYPSDMDLDEYEWVELTSLAEWIPYPENNINGYSNFSMTSIAMDNDF